MDTITYETVDNLLSQWQQYIDPKEFAILREFVYNTANHIPCDKMLIFCGPGSTGKTTLVQQLFALIGKQNCLHSSLKYKKDDKEEENDDEDDEENDDEDDEEIVKNNDCTRHLIVYNHEAKKICDGYIKLILSRQTIFCKPLYQETQCYFPTANIILVSNDIRPLNETLLMRSNVIHFTHRF